MSNSATPERPVPPHIAWDRRVTMRGAVKMIAANGKLRLENAARIAASYGPDITTAEVEAEMMKYQAEDDGK